MTRSQTTKRLVRSVFVLAFLVTTAVYGAPLYTVGPAVAPDAPIAEAVAIHAIDIDSTVLDGASELTLGLPDGGTLVASRSGLERRSGGLTWRGFVGEDRVVMTRHKGLLAGAFWLGSRVFEIQPNGGNHLLVELDSNAFAACAGGVEEPPRELATAESTPSAKTDLDTGVVGTTGAVTEGSTVNMDVMIVYTPQARTAAGGTASMQATAQAAVDAANTGFIDSLGDGRFTLVHAAEVLYNDTGNISADLTWVANDLGVRLLRETWRADMVGLIVENGGSACGIGFVMRTPGPGFASSAFQVTDRGCAVGNLSYAHEHGHNMGFEHDPANGISPGSASFPYSFGHFVNGSYRTIMSYSNQCPGGCTRVPHWSNPDVDHNGVPTGVAEQRHNQLSGNQTAPIVADFREGFLFFDGFENGDFSGWTSTVQ